MTKQRWLEVKPILDRALDLPSADRETFISEACGNDSDLLQEVVAFLDFEAADDDTLFEVPILDLIAGRPPEYRNGQTIGAYRLEGEIARGGMGVVYGADRVEGGFEQRVAIKVLKRGFDTGDFVRRFRTEQQILSDLDHPNIARLLDGGATEDGLPYLVMERVDGRRLDDYLSEASIGLERQLELLIKVCQAVHAAHQHMVVHCDLKPSNVLVTSEHEPKLLDFGIAKVLSQSPEATQSLSLRLGTPQYVSPEQVAGGRITTASDVFSLGGLLFLVLTGSAPTAMREPDQVSELASRVCKSNRPGRAERLRGDLDAIVLKARAFHPDQRYPSAAAMAEDLSRHLEGQTVTARPYSWHYALGRFLGRHRREVLVAGILLLGLAFGLHSWVQYQWALGRMKDAYLEMLEVVDPTAHESRTKSLQTAVSELEELEPFTGAKDLAELYDRMGRQFYRWNGLDEAEDLHRRALELRASGSDALDTAASLNNLALVLSAKGEIEEAAQLLAQAHDLFADAAEVDDEKKAPFYDILHNLAGLERRLGHAQKAERIYREALTERTEFHGPQSMQVARTTHNLGLLLLRQHRLQESEALISRSIEIRKKVLEDPNHLLVMQAQMSLATLRDAQGRLDEAVELHRQVLEQRLSVLEESNLGVARSRSALASSLHHRGRPEDLLEAESLFKTALGTLLESRSAGPEHESTWVVQRNLAALWISTGRAQEAETLLRELTARADQWGPADRWRASDIRSLLGESLMAQGRWAEAGPLIEGAWEIIKWHRGTESRFATQAHERWTQWRLQAHPATDTPI